MSSYADATLDFPVFGLPSQSYVGVATSTVQRHLDAASEFADSCIQSRGQLPLATPYPQDLIQRVCEIAAFTLLKTIGFNPESPNDVAVLDAHDRARDYLDEIMNGKRTPNWLPVAPQFAVSSDSPRGYYYPDGQPPIDDGSGTVR